MPRCSSAYFLVGPTASGKTAVAEILARRTGAYVLSADSMLVYRGMDVGTAKPGPDERAGGRLRGVDVVEADEPFSTGLWLVEAARAFDEAEAEGRDVIVAGGTGLYVSALLRGIDEPPAPPEVRAEVEAVAREGGVAALLSRIESLCRGAAAAVDVANPRRIMRLMEILLCGGRPPQKRGAAAPPAAAAAPMAGLEFPPDLLAARIERRAAAMFEGGALLREVEALCARRPGFATSTAGAGIGYAEALALLRGEITEGEAVERTAARTRRLAKRQRTWWRTQAAVEWARGPEDAADAERAARDVAAIWRKNGKTPVVLP